MVGYTATSDREPLHCQVRAQIANLIVSIVLVGQRMMSVSSRRRDASMIRKPAKRLIKSLLGFSTGDAHDNNTVPYQTEPKQNMQQVSSCLLQYSEAE